MSMQVESQTMHCPLSQGINVNPSGFLPSSLDKPSGCSFDGALIEDKALCKISLKSLCRAKRAFALFEQLAIDAVFVH